MEFLDRQGNAIQRGDRVEWIPTGDLGTVQRLIDQPNEHDIAIAWDDHGSLTYMHRLICRHLRLTGEKGDPDLDVPAGQWQIAAGG
jgi:hypothetical protein